MRVEKVEAPSVLEEPRVPSRCPVCGAYSLDPQANTSALLAVCDVLVLKALEQVGKKTAREASRKERRFQSYRDTGQPWYLAHTVWPPSEVSVEKVLETAWDVVPALLDSHGNCGVTVRQVRDMLDEYVRDLSITGTPHSLNELCYRFEDRLGLPVPREQEICEAAHA